MSLAAFDGVAVADLASILGLTIPTALPVWVTLKAADFADGIAAPSFDPNGIVTNPTTIHATNGNVTSDTTEQGVVRDGIGEGASYRLNWPAGWVGDGSTALLVRLTAIAAPGADIVTMGLAVCDRGGNPTNAAAVCFGASIQSFGVPGLQVRFGWTARTASTQLGTQIAVGGNVPSLLVAYAPSGRIGNAANVGLQSGRLGGLQMVWRQNSITVLNDFATESTQAQITDGFYPLLTLGWSSFGVQNAVWTVRYEWATVPLFPANEWV